MGYLPRLYKRTLPFVTILYLAVKVTYHNVTHVLLPLRNSVCSHVRSTAHACMHACIYLCIYDVRCNVGLPAPAPLRPRPPRPPRPPPLPLLPWLSPPLLPSPPSRLCSRNCSRHPLRCGWSRAALASFAVARGRAICCLKLHRGVYEICSFSRGFYQTPTPSFMGTRIEFST